MLPLKSIALTDGIDAVLHSLEQDRKIMKSTMWKPLAEILKCILLPCSSDTLNTLTAESMKMDSLVIASFY